jgi:hypothetical protein
VHPDVKVTAAALTATAATVAAALVWPLYTSITIAAIAGIATLVWLGRADGGNALMKWPIRLLPLHLAAALAPVNAGLTLIPLAFVLFRRWPRPGAVDVLAIAFTVWATYCDAQHWPGPTGSRFYWALCLLIIATRHLVTNAREFVSVCIAYVAGCMCIAAQVILQAPSSTGAEWRPTTGANINYTAYVLLTGVVLIVAIGVVAPANRRILVAQVAAAAVLAGGIWFTGTRAALLGLGVGLAFVVTRRLTASRAGWRLLTTAVPVLLLAIALGWYGDAHLPELERMFNRQTGDLSGRLDVWPYAREIWESAQVAGIGMNHFRSTNPLGIGAHNIVLTLGLDFGWLGLGLYAAMVAASLAGLGRHVQTRRLGGLLLISWTLIWATGHWEAASAAWLVLGLWSRLPELFATTASSPFSSAPPSDRRPRSSSGPTHRSADLSAAELQPATQG